MAYRIPGKNVLDLRPDIGIGVAIPFNQPGVFRTVYTTSEQIKYNLINFILTNPGERVFEPGFGLGLRRSLFEQLATQPIQDLEQRFKAGIEAYFTNLEVIVLKIQPVPDTNTLSITFTYRVITTNIEDEVTINIDNG